MKLYIAVEMCVYGFLTFCHQRAWEVNADLNNKAEYVHSFYSLERFDAPYYSWTHKMDQKEKTKIYLAQRNPSFARIAFGNPLAMAHEGEYSLCLEMIDDI